MLDTVRFKIDYFTAWKVRKLYVDLYKICNKYQLSESGKCDFDQYGFIKSQHRYATIDDLYIYNYIVDGVKDIIPQIRALEETILYPKIMDAKYPHVHWAYHCVNNKIYNDNYPNNKRIMDKDERYDYYLHNARKDTCNDFKNYAQVEFPKIYRRKWSGINYMITKSEEVLRYYGETNILDVSTRKKIVFFTGSGISQESGIPTFRDSDGLWEQYPVDAVASVYGWLSDPDFVNDFYNKLRIKYLNIDENGVAGIVPNGAHIKIAEIAKKNLDKNETPKPSSIVDNETYIDENKYEVVIITQNVDDLHERAINQVIGGEKDNHYDIYDKEEEDNKCCSDCECDDCEVESSDDPTINSDSESDDGWGVDSDSESEQKKYEDCPHDGCECEVKDDDCCGFYGKDFMEKQESIDNNEPSIKLIHLHGQLLKMCADGDKENKWYHLTLPYDGSLELPVEYRVKDVFPKADDAHKNKRMRPYIVFFGEDVPNMVKAIDEVETCDAFVIIGTSLQVYPAAGLLDFVPKDTPIIYIDPNPDYVNKPNIRLIQTTATKGMDILINNWNDYILNK